MLAHIPVDTVRDLFMNFPVATCLIGRDGTLVAANNEYAQLIGTTAHETIGRHIRDLCGEHVYSRALRDFATFDAGGSVSNHELHFADRFYLVAVRPQRDARTGRITAICVALTDISEQKALEKRLELANEQLSAVNRRLEEAARVDAVTGLWNRHALEELLPREISRSRRDGSPIAVLMVDIDYFKKYNDRYGHLAGDAALRDTAQAMEEALLRPGDMIARYGGEEFLVVLPATDAQAALKVAEHLRSAVAALDIVDETSHFGRLTISIGVASRNLIPRDAVIEDVRLSLVQSADQALYAVKSQGRDGIRLHTPTLPSL